ncbi:histidine phosphatase superfamily [Armillaria luteobubalina]|uniref:Histidine phosphatase superfamily n=1 Tax=Armillaria luteobubalina TaxID=153913 RepID=A0AA39QIA0_9AGAR|nr:histidine phosphatase superfamily [Armillaria luteobubalina]
MADNGTLLGVVLLARHGDREGTSISSPSADFLFLQVQEFQLGQLLRSLYLNSSSPSFIPGINSTVVNLDQIQVRADGGDEGGVIVNSAMSLLQGLFPATSSYNVTLANGTNVVAPLGGYQSVEPDNDVSLEGWTSCGAFDTSTNAFYNSTEFQAKVNESASFISQLSPYLDGRPVTLKNMIYDYMNVENIHDASFAASIPDTFMEQARDLANWHEYGVFSSVDLAGIGNIAARAMLPSIFEDFTSITASDDSLKISYLALAYKPFLSSQMNPQLQGIVNYAAAVALEIRNSSSSGETVLRFKFKNGTDDNGFTTYNILNSTGDVPLSTFVNYLSPAAVNTTADWCKVCGNTEDRGCGALALAASEASAAARVNQRISPVGAGFLGAGLTLAVCLAMLGVLIFLGFLTVGKGRSRQQRRPTTITEKA